MKRRSFLSFLIGGAAGTALSPLPFKLVDDISIWTQNWPWTPVPKRGNISWVDSTCTLCPGGCGISVRKSGDKVVKIEGKKGHPVNDGKICIMGASAAQILYGQSRVKSPLVRAGKRGEGRWRKVTWGFALESVASKLNELKSDGNQRTLGCISGTYGSTVPALFERFLNAFGSLNFIKTASVFDQYENVIYSMQNTRAKAGFDIENTDYLLSFGSGILEGWGSPVRMFQANSRRIENRGKLVQIEPRLSNTAAKADIWLPIKPGTETDVAFAIASVIIKNSLFNRDFISKYADNFEQFGRWVINKYKDDNILKATGIDKRVIEKVARQFALSARPLAICGRGKGETPGSFKEVAAVQILNALVGNIGGVGGFWPVPEPDYIAWPKVSDISGQRTDLAGTSFYPNARHIPNALSDGGNYDLNALFVLNSNPYFCMTGNIRKTLDKIPFIVSFSPYMDETALNSDIILPDHTFLEKDEDAPFPVGFNRPYIGLVRRAVAPVFDSRHAGRVILDLAAKVGGETAEAFASWRTYDECLKTTLSDKWNELARKGFWIDDSYSPSIESKIDFGQVDAFTKDTEIEGDPSSYPLVLIPADSLRSASGFISNTPFLTKTLPDTVLKGKDVFVEINSATASSLGLYHGSMAVLTTPRASVKVRVNLSEGIRPGLIAMPTGLGHKVKNEYIAGKGVNFNELIGPVQDAVSGLDSAWGIRAKLARA